MNEITIRSATTSEEVVLRDSFLRSYGRTPHGRGIPAEVLWGQIDALLAAGWRLDVAVLAEVPDEVMGYVLWSHIPNDARPTQPTLAWLFVKPKYRGRGIGRRLLECTGAAPGDLNVAFVDPLAAKWITARGYVLRLRPHLATTAAYELARQLAS